MASLAGSRGLSGVTEAVIPVRENKRVLVQEFCGAAPGRNRRGANRQPLRRRQAICRLNGVNLARHTDIADQRSICPWNPDMFGVDMRKAGAQAYYDSLFQLYVSWGVDLVKVDDIARPYNTTMGRRRRSKPSARRLIKRAGPSC
jgi:hypothetical protein